MKRKFFDSFKLLHEQESYDAVEQTISSGVVFRGTNLWVLIFAIFVASLGLNVNSTAVIIGAMLISPLMGPIMGLGLGMGINDLVLLKKSFYNYSLAALVGLSTSTLFFLLSPISDAHSEILARTSPNIYDVLIAFFGGLAGILATSSKQKGNVIPGVAIATALMPPLCTAGYGLATLKFTFFFGALYLFIINTVFIALATLLTVRWLKFPVKHLLDEEAEKKARRLVWVIVLVTFLPSIYFGYDIVQRDRFTKNANEFIDKESSFTNDYLLSKEIDAQRCKITLVYGGKKIEETEISGLKSRLKYYKLEHAVLEVKQGFAYLNETKDNKVNEQLTLLSHQIEEKDKQIQAFELEKDSAQEEVVFNNQLVKEAKALNPSLKNVSLAPLQSAETENDTDNVYLAYMQFEKMPDKKEQKQIEDWLSAKLNRKLKTVFSK